MAEKTTIARPYAQAVFELAQGQGDLKAWSEMLRLTALIMADPQIQALIGNPRVSHEQLLELLLALCGDTLGTEEENFIRLLIEYRRLDLLPEIAAQYELQRAEAEGTLHAEVISAFPLDKKQQATIADVLHSQLDRIIDLSCTIDKGLLGGVIIRAGDSVIDGSARGQLQRLASVLGK